MKTSHLIVNGCHEKTWKNLNCISLSEKSQFEKAAYCMFQLYGILEETKVMRQEKQQQFLGDEGER